MQQVLVASHTAHTFAQRMLQNPGSASSLRDADYSYCQSVRLTMVALVLVGLKAHFSCGFRSPTARNASSVPPSRAFSGQPARFDVSAAGQVNLPLRREQSQIFWGENQIARQMVLWRV